MPGVAFIVTYGGFIKQYQVEPDLAKMKAYGVTLQQLFTAAEAARNHYADFFGSGCDCFAF